MPRAACTFAIALALSTCLQSVQAFEARSDLTQFRIAAANRLPAPLARQTFEDGDFCRHLRVEPKTVAGRQAAGLGWYVTSEEHLAGYTAVGIFSRGANATSGTCLVADGNIVLYRDHRPVAIVYEPPHPDDEGGAIGGVVSTLSADRLRISDFTPAGFQSADLLLGPDSVAVVKIAAMETACGNAPVPNLRGMTVAQARKALAPRGWRPAGDPKAADGNAHDAATGYREKGLTEYETCSGTGYGFCAVRYAHTGGAVLSVTTVGDDASVSGYPVQCPKGG